MLAPFDQYFEATISSSHNIEFCYGKCSRKNSSKKKGRKGSTGYVHAGQATALYPK
jgi:hypothetical protein